MKEAGEMLHSICIRSWQQTHGEKCRGPRWANRGRLAGLSSQPRDIDELTHGTDLLPTLLDLCAIDEPAGARLYFADLVHALSADPSVALSRCDFETRLGAATGRLGLYV